MEFIIGWYLEPGLFTFVVLTPLSEEALLYSCKSISALKKIA
jgi:hypothetical protein